MPTSARDIVLTDSTRRWLRWIGSWQMIGGGISALILLDSFRRLPDDGGWSLVFVGACLLVALLSVAAGYALHQRRAEGIVPSLGLQLIQTLAVATDTIWVQFIFGPSITLDLVWDQLVKLSFAFRPSFQLHIPATVPLNAGVSINLLALFCFMRLLFMDTAAPITSGDAAASDSGATESAA